MILFDLLLWHITISETFGTTFVHLEIHSNANTDYQVVGDDVVLELSNATSIHDD